MPEASLKPAVLFECEVAVPYAYLNGGLNRTITGANIRKPSADVRLKWEWERQNLLLSVAIATSVPISVACPLNRVTLAGARSVGCMAPVVGPHVVAATWAARRSVSPIKACIHTARLAHAYAEIRSLSVCRV